MFTLDELRKMLEQNKKPSWIVDQSRRHQIAAGAGVEDFEVSSLVKQFDALANIMKHMGRIGWRP